MSGSPDTAPKGFLPVQLRDRVVIMLLFDQIIREEHVIEAWDLWKRAKEEGSEEPLWRVMATLPDLDRDLIHAEAARVYGFDEVNVRPHLAVRLVKRLKRQVRSQVWDQMVKLRVLPVDEKARAIGYRPRIVFGTHDPTRPEVKWLLRKSFPDRYKLGYVPERVLHGLLAEVNVEAEDSLARFTTSFEDASFRIPWIASDSVNVVAEPSTEPQPEPETDEEETDQPTFIQILEDALVAAVEEEASAVCLSANSEGHTEFLFQIDGDLVEWRVEDEISSEVLMTAVKSYILEIDDSASQVSQDRILRRWIDGELVRFRLRWCPAGGKLPNDYAIAWIE